MKIHINILIFSLTVLVGGFLVVGTVSAATITRPANNMGLMGYWPLNEGAGTTVTDFSGNGNTGTYSTAVWADGKRGKALRFNNTDSVDIDYNSSFNITNRSFTISAWVKPDVGETGTFFGAHELGGTQRSLHFRVYDTGIFRAGYYSQDLNTSAGAVTAGEWNHIVVTYDLGLDTTTIYIDGEYVISGGQGPFTGSGHQLKIGSWYGTSEIFDGLVDDVRAYSRALSASDVSALYQSGNAKRKVADNNGLVGYWSFNEGVGAQAGDSSGNDNTGTITGATWADGKHGKALSFNGSSDKINIGNLSTGVLSSFSVAMWVNSNSLADHGNDTSVLCFNSGSLTRLLLDNRTNPFLRARWRKSDGSYTYYSLTDDFSSNVWHQIVVTYDNQILTGYLDGNEVIQNLSVDSYSTFDNVTLGYCNPFDYMDGLLDDVRLYNRALSVAEIASLAQQTETKHRQPDNTGLIGYWSFNEGDGNEAGDFSGNGNSGTITGSTWIDGKRGRALSANGSSDYVGINDPDNFNQDVFTVSAWVKTTVSGTFKTFVGRAMSTQGWNFLIHSNNKLALRMDTTTNTNGYPSSTGPEINDGKWHHVVAAVDLPSSQIDLYVDGQNAGTSGSIGGTFNETGGTLNILGPALGTGYTNGSADEVRIYNRILEVSEIQALYEMGK